MTFDGLVLTFPGACEYLLVREASGQFAVSAQNLPCGAGGLTCTKALTVRLWGTVVHMLRGGCDTEGPHGGRGWGTPRSVTAPRRRGVPCGPPWLASAQCSWFLGWESALGKALRNEGPGRSNDFPKVTRLE